MITLIGSLLRGGIDVLRNRESADDIESELNAQFNGKQFSVSNYQGEEIVLTLEAIRARPKFCPMEEGRGVAQVEGNNLFTEVEKKRDDPKFREKLWAMVFRQWITIVRLKIDNGDAESIRPTGLNFGYVTATTSIRYQGYDDTPEFSRPISPIRVADTHGLQSDKLEIKIRYDGQIGNYAQRISDSIDLLQEIQDDMEYYGTIYLLDLHNSSRNPNEDGYSWSDEKRARDLSEFLFDHPVELGELERIASEMKSDINAQE